MNSEKKAMLVRLDANLLQLVEEKASAEYMSREAYVRRLIESAVGKRGTIQPQRPNIWMRVRARDRKARTAPRAAAASRVRGRK